MVKEFLNRYDQELQTSRLEKTENLDLINTKILETQKLLKLMESETEEVFTDFTPRTVYSKNADKIEELNEELQNLHSEKEELENAIKLIDSRLSELHSSLEEIDSFGEIVPPNEKNVSRETSSSTYISKDKLHLVLSYLPQDPMRAKIELENLLK